MPVVRQRIEGSQSVLYGVRNDRFGRLSAACDTETAARIAGVYPRLREMQRLAQRDGVADVLSYPTVRNKLDEIITSIKKQEQDGQAL